jgi:flagellar capping protein FliD
VPAPCNLFTLTNALLLLASGTNIPKDIAKTINCLSEVAIRINSHCTGCTKAVAFPELLAELRSDIQHGVEDKLAQIHQSLNDKVANKEVFDKTVEKLEGVVKDLNAAATEIEAKIAKISGSASQLTTSTNSYRDALLKGPPLGNVQHNVGNPTTPIIGKMVDRRNKQVLIELSMNKLPMSSLEGIKDKAAEAIKKVSVPPPEEGI